MHQLTYEELYKLIEQMTLIQRQHPVKMYVPTDGELHPQDESAHPDHGFSSKLILTKEVKGFHSCEDKIYKNQYIIEEYLNEEASKACEILHCKRILSSENSTTSQKNHALKRLKKLGEDVSEYL